jgi:glycosyltransferase involved in cell wall biosynthesis
VLSLSYVFPLPLTVIEESGTLKKIKLLEIGPYPPPNSGWSVRIKYLKDSFDMIGHDCKVLNLGKTRYIKSDKYIDVQNGIDYVIKLIVLRFKGYHFHVHINAQAVKGPILSLIAILISILTFKRAALTFHGGYKQLYFPKRNAGKVYWIIYLNFLLSKVIICNDEAIKQLINKYGIFIGEKKIYPIQAFSVQYFNYNKTKLSQKVEEYVNRKKNIICCYAVLRKGFFLEILIGFLKKQGPETGIILTGIRNVEDKEISDYYLQLKELEKKGTILLVDNLDHNQFMTLLSKSKIYLRTYVSDGVASSVLESLALKVPVVASDNGRRPHGVIVYDAEDVYDLESKIKYVLANNDKVKHDIIVPVIRDTVKDEIDLLVDAF